MGTPYRITRPDGSVEYTDVPNGAGRIDSISNNSRQESESGASVYDHQEVKSLIKEVQKRAVKINDYLDYLTYLRNNSAVQFDRVMRELQREDPQTWLKLQKYPQFRPLRNTALGLKAADKHLAAGIGVMTGKYTGSVEKWLETTVKDMMKRDRWGPYADVLGAKASTLPATPVPTYSNSRLGQYLKVEDVRAAQAAKDAAKELETSRAAVRLSKATASTRVLSPILDFGINALDPDNAKSIGTALLHQKAQRLFEKDVIDEEQWAETQQLISQGRFVELQRFLDDATNAYVRGKP